MGGRLARWQAQAIVEFMRDNPDVAIKELSRLLSRSEDSLHGIRMTYGPRIGLPMKGQPRAPDPSVVDRYLIQEVVAQLNAQVEAQKEELLRLLRKGKTVVLRLEVTPPRPPRARLL